MEERGMKRMREMRREDGEDEPDIANDGERVLVCRRTNACPFHRNRKKRCPANWYAFLPFL